MRRMLIMIVTLLLLMVPALADTTWTEETVWGDTITYTRMDMDWGYIIYNETDDLLVNFKYGNCTFAPCDDFVSVHDEMTGLQTFYRDERWDAFFTHDELSVWAEELLHHGDTAFVHDVDQGKLILPGIGEADLPAGQTCQIADAYIRQQRLFMTIDMADGRHFLYIVTWKDTLDVRAIEIPWSGSFDTFHVGPESDDHFILHLDANEDFGYVVAGEVEGRWILNTINTGWDIIDIADWGVRSDVNSYWAYGDCPWRDLETMDWNTLPLTYEDAAAGMTHQGWMFAKAQTCLLASPDNEEAVLIELSADTPLCILRTEGDWAFVGVQMTEGCFLRDEDWWGPWVGYVPLDMLTDMPQSFLPGGEIYGWFVTMTVEPGSGRYYDNSVTIRFASIDNQQDFMPLEVMKDFVEHARAIYREKGYAATPLGFDESLLPDLVVERYKSVRDGVVHDAVVTENKLLLAMQDADGVWKLRIFQNDLVWTDIRMPGPFRFSRESVADTFDYAFEFTE